MEQQSTLLQSVTTGVVRFIARALKWPAWTRKKTADISVGTQGEQRAAAFLRKLGYRIVRKNYRCRGGEIDIIARDGNTLVFVEVKTRVKGGYELPEASVTGRKKQRLRRAARHFMRAYHLGDCTFRFDVIGVEHRVDADWQLRHWTNVIDYRKH